MGSENGRSNETTETEAAPSSYPSQGAGLDPQPLWPSALPGPLPGERIRRLPRMSPTEDGCDVQYRALERVLRQCYAQAAQGKGRERHTDGGEEFTQQFICHGQRLVGIGFGLGQALKKALEANRFAANAQNAKAIVELLGAINYLAAAVIILEEKSDARPAR